MENLVPALMTLDEAADHLGAVPAQVLVWAAEGRLPVAARSEGGQLLFYRWRVEREGPALVADELVRFKKGGRRGHAMFHDARRHPCGCAFAGPRGDQDGRAAGEPIWLCADARALQSAMRLTAAFVAAAPADPFFRRLAEVTREALARHLGCVEGEAASPAALPPCPRASAGVGFERLVPRFDAEEIAADR